MKSSSMAPDGPDVRTYQALAEGYDRQAQPQMRDRFLVLAAHAAFMSGQTAEADKLRSRLLLQNPHHLLKPYSNFAEAMNSVDVQNYIGALSRSHPPERVMTLLAAMKNDPPLAHSTPIRPIPSAEITPAELKVYRLRTPVLVDGSERDSISKKDSLPQIFGIRPDVPPQRPELPKPLTLDDPPEERKPLTPMVLAALILTIGCILAAYTLLRPLLRSSQG